MATSSQVFFTGTSSPGASYSTTTLTASLTTAFTSESVYTNNGQEETTTFLVATVIPPDTVVINETATKPPPKKKTIIIVGAALGGFIFLVVVCLAVLALTRRRRRKRPHMLSAPPSVAYASPMMPHASLTPFGSQPSQGAQPYHEPLLMSESRNAAFPSPVISEKRQRNVLQRSQGHLRGPSDGTITDSGSSIRSQPQTTSSGISPSPMPGFYQPVHKGHQPPSHQRSMSGGSDAGSVGTASDRRNSVGPNGQAPSVSRVPVSTPPSFGPMSGHPGMPTAPMIHEETPPGTPHHNQVFQQQARNQSFQPERQNQPYQQQQGQTQFFQQPPQDQTPNHRPQQGYTSTSGSNVPTTTGSYHPVQQHRPSYHAQSNHVEQGPAHGQGMDGANDSETHLEELPPAYADLPPRTERS